MDADLRGPNQLCAEVDPERGFEGSLGFGIDVKLAT